LNLSNLRFEVANAAWLVEALDLDGIGGGFLEEVSEFEGLHQVVAEGAAERERSLRGGSESLELQLVLEVTQDWGLEHQVNFLLADDKGTIADFKATLGLGRDLQLLRS